jgi:hypothetical protein
MGKNRCLGLLLVVLAAGCSEGAAVLPAAPPPSVPPLAPPGSEAPSPAPGPQAGPRFEECAEKAGLKFHNTFLRPEQGENFKINLYDHGSGLAVADVDGDGKDDVLLLNQLGPNALFRNKGDGTFEDVTAKSGVALDDRICVAAAFGDADGDGDQDLYVTTTRAGNVYFRNEGGCRFVDATKDAGLTFVAESEIPTFFDADGDGDLDLFVTNTARWTLETYDESLKYWRGKRSLDELIQSEKQHDVFYRNDGKGRFVDATKEAGLEGKGWGGDVAVFDVEGDGDLDLFVCNMFGSSALYRNDGKAKFADVTREVLGKTSWGAVGARAFDYDGDGLLDLYVVDMHSDMWMPFKGFEADQVNEKAKYPSFLHRAIELGFVKAAEEREFEVSASVRRDEVVFGSTLFRNKGNGAFEEVSDRAGAETFWPWGVAEGDFDSDGHLDAYIPSGMGHPLFYWRSPLLRNRGDGTFEDVCKAAGTEPPPGGPLMETVIEGKRARRSARAAATADFDGDGRLDIVVNNFNERAYLWRNVSPAARWCQVSLVASKGDRSAVGALVKLTAGGRTQVRQVQAAGGYLSQSSNRLHFGLGAAASVDRVEIRWPSGATQVVEKPKVDALTVITEPAK